MSRIFALLLAAFSISTAASADTSFAENVNAVMAPASAVISGFVFYTMPMDWLIPGAPGMPLICVWLAGAAVFFTLYLRFINLRGFVQALRIVRGTYDDPKDPGEVTHFQALTAAVSATVGLGNIAGVALAVSIGGPGATFWMVLIGLFAMTSKFVECTMGVKYRIIDENGTVSGGPMYYLSRGLEQRGLPGLGKILGVLAAIICIGGAIGAGAMFQVNQSSAQFTAEIAALTGGEDSLFFGRQWIFGVLFAGFVALVIFGGIKGITQVTEKLVPIMATIYVSAALIIIFMNIEEIPRALSEIIAGAFTAAGVEGGIVGVLVQGLRRATFSNEAGLGSAAIAHAAAKTKEPVAEGLVALLEPFIDTVVICTMTALVIIITQSADPSATEGIALTSRAFASVIDWFPYVLTIAVVLFAFSTSITWFYYGQRAFLYLFGGRSAADTAFKAIFLISVVIGSAMNLVSVMDIADALLLAMGIPNILGLLIMRREIKDMLNSYFARLKSGEIQPYAH